MSISIDVQSRAPPGLLLRGASALALLVAATAPAGAKGKIAIVKAPNSESAFPTGTDGSIMGSRVGSAGRSKATCGLPTEPFPYPHAVNHALGFRASLLPARLR